MLFALLLLLLRPVVASSAMNRCAGSEQSKRYTRATRRLFPTQSDGEAQRAAKQNPYFVRADDASLSAGEPKKAKKGGHGEVYGAINPRKPLTSS